MAVNYENETMKMFEDFFFFFCFSCRAFETVELLPLTVLNISLTLIFGMLWPLETGSEFVRNFALLNCITFFACSWADEWSLNQVRWISHLKWRKYVEFFINSCHCGRSAKLNNDSRNRFKMTNLNVNRFTADGMWIESTKDRFSCSPSSYRQFDFCHFI